MNILTHIQRVLSKDWGIIYISKKNPPVEGDSITVGNLVAVFKKKD